MQRSALVLALLVAGCGQGVFSAPPNTSTLRRPPIDLGAQVYDRDLGDLSFYIDQTVPPDDLQERHDVGVTSERDEGLPDDLHRATEDLRKQDHDLSHSDLDTSTNK